MNENSDKHRVVIAVTETRSLTNLWHVALRSTQRPATEVVVVYIDDERWQRAAFLPFTCEVSRIGGSVADLTPERAAQIGEQAVEETRRHIEQLASHTNLAHAFEVLTPSNHERLADLVSSDSLVVLPLLLSRSPLVRRLERTGCRILTVAESEYPGGRRAAALGDSAG